MADLLSQKVKFLRNAIAYATYELAKTAIIEKVQSLEDGEIVLATYVDVVNGNNGYRTILGVSRGEKGYEIFDNKAANDAIKALDATVENESEDKHVKVNIVETDGILTSVTVTTSDIASAALLGTKEDAKTVDTAFGRIAKEVADRTAAIEALDATVSSNDTNVNVSITEAAGKLTGLTVSEDYAEVTRTATSSSETTPKTDAALTVKAGDEVKLIKASDLANVAAYAADKVKEETDARKKAIADLDVEQIGDGTTYIKSVSETDGKIAATTGILNTDAVAFVKTVGKHSALDKATTTTQALDALEDAIEESTMAQKEYKLSPATVSDANVKEAWKIQVKDGSATEYIDVEGSSVIKIYKDSALIEVYLGTTDDTINEETGEITKVESTDKQSLNFKYQLANGKYSLTKIDVSKFLTESEFKDGLQVNNINGEVSVKIDTQSEGFLTVSESGVKLSGVQNAITNAINALDKEETTASASGAHVTVKYSEADGIVSMNVTESDIASAQGLEKEIADRQAAIEALDYTDNAITNQYVSKVDEVNGKIEVTRTALPVISVASDNSSVNVTNTSGAVNVQVHVDNNSIVVCADTDHKGELTVGTIDCGTY